MRGYNFIAAVGYHRLIKFLIKSSKSKCITWVSECHWQTQNGVDQDGKPSNALKPAKNPLRAQSSLKDVNE